MEKSYIFVVLLSIAILVSSCSGDFDEFSIEDTNIKLNVPIDWLQINDNEFDNLVLESDNSINLPPQYISAIQQAQTTENISTNLFINPYTDSSNAFNSSIMTISSYLYGRSILLTDVVEIQKQQALSLPGISQHSEGRCPPMSFDAYKCFMITSNVTGQPITQYQYILIDNGRLVQIAFTSSTSEHLQLFTNIIQNVSR